MIKINRIYYWFVGHPTRINYWSCTDFADYLRTILSVTKKPLAETSNGWYRWRSENVGTFGYWVTEVLLNRIQNTLLFIPDVYRNISLYIHNRYIDKTHYINTKLEKGKYYEFDTRLLHGLFEMLVDFVEVEKASRQSASEHINNEGIIYNKKDYPISSREAGLKYLDWEIGLGEASQSQAEVAKEIKELYLWWKDIRTNRVDPMEESGWTAHCDSERLAGRELFGCSIKKRTEKDEIRVQNIFELMHKLEDTQNQEDTDMLIRLIKIRKSCWT